MITQVSERLDGDTAMADDVGDYRFAPVTRIPYFTRRAKGDDGLYVLPL